MKPSPKSIALIIASPAPAGKDGGGKEIDLARPNYPSAFLPKEAGFPDLSKDWEGDITFHVKVAHSDEHGAQLDLMSMTAPNGVSTVKKSDPLADANADFEAANGMGDDD